MEGGEVGGGRKGRRKRKARREEKYLQRRFANMQNNCSQLPRQCDSV